MIQINGVAAEDLQTAIGTVYQVAANNGWTVFVIEQLERGVVVDASGAVLSGTINSGIFDVVAKRLDNQPGQTYAYI